MQLAHLLSGAEKTQRDEMKMSYLRTLESSSQRAGKLAGWQAGQLAFADRRQRKWRAWLPSKRAAGWLFCAAVSIISLVII